MSTEPEALPVDLTDEQIDALAVKTIRNVLVDFVADNNLVSDRLNPHVHQDVQDDAYDVLIERLRSAVRKHAGLPDAAVLDPTPAA